MRSYYRSKGHYLPKKKNNKRDGQTNKLNASRDRGQYDCYITAIEIGNNEEI